MKPIAFVIPWYGDDIRGGAESECNYLAHKLTEAGISVEVLTTCVREATDDRSVNTLVPGVYKESGVIVRRFLVRERCVEEFNRVNQKLYNNEQVSLEDEDIYFKEDINSPDLYLYIRGRKEEYSCFIFMPYMYGTTYNGMKECPEKAILIPCLHDESYAYMKRMKECVESFKWIIFHAKAESDFAHRIYRLNGAKTSILGEGVDSDWHNKCNPQAFKEKYNLFDNFVLYAGRKDAGKKADELVEFFTKYKLRRKDSNLKLVTIGGGSLYIPDVMKDQIFDLGFVSVEDKHNAFAAAAIFCNPSFYESFSIVIMESWLAKRPVLVSEHCAVTTNFCLEANGGLFYKNFAEFEACIEYLLSNREVGDIMGMNGFRYVMENFTHEIIAEKYVSFLKDVLQ